MTCRSLRLVTMCCRSQSQGCVSCPPSGRRQSPYRRSYANLLLPQPHQLPVVTQTITSSIHKNLQTQLIQSFTETLQQLKKLQIWTLHPARMKVQLNDPCTVLKLEFYAFNRMLLCVVVSDCGYGDLYFVLCKGCTFISIIRTASYPV